MLLEAVANWTVLVQSLVPRRARAVGVPMNLVAFDVLLWQEKASEEKIAQVAAEMAKKKAARMAAANPKMNMVGSRFMCICRL